MTAIALVAIAALAACESNGHTRYASIGTVGPGGSNGGDGSDGGNGSDGSDGQNGGPGVQGPPGPAGPAGPQGPAGPTGPQGEPGGNFALGDTGLIATGGLVGPSGIGGTGLLANLGDTSTSIPVVSDVSTSAGSIISATGTNLDAALGETNLPTELASVTGAVTQTVTNLGGALESFGTDGAPLVDGVTSAVSPVLTASLGGGTLAGDESAGSLIGVSLLSPDQQSGTLAEIGVASDGTLLSADLSTSTDTALVLGSVASVDLGPLTGGVNDLLGETSLTEVTSLLEGGTVDSGLLSGLTAPVQDLLTSGGDVPETPLTPILSGTTGLLGGLLGGGAN
ncbi:hypothetical protein BBF93_13985 [Hyphomonas sp. CACIAM 19H1]|nr:hypothetical protein BBF93_13985 [Hyphomonas sp. CACIAM 19H1]